MVWQLLSSFATITKWWWEAFCWWGQTSQVVEAAISHLFQQHGQQMDQSLGSGILTHQPSLGSLSSWSQNRNKGEMNQIDTSRWLRRYTDTHTHRSDLLSWLGANQNPEGSLAVKTLSEENLHFRERSEEHQVSVYGIQLLPHLQASHLNIEYNKKKTWELQNMYY